MNIDDNKNLEESIEYDELCFRYNSSSDKEEEDIINNEGKFSESREVSNCSYKIQEVEKKLNELSYDDMWGIEFDTVDQCCDFYRNYARVHGFVARLDEKGQDFNGNLNMRQMLCNREGTNDHGQTCIFGCGLLSDEKRETYILVLNMFMEIIGNKQPIAVVTDGDLAMREAIKEVLPNVAHRLCAWHLYRNACEAIKNSKFLDGLKHLIHDHIDIIPDTLVCTRWTKNAKKDYVCSVTSAETDSENIDGIRYGALATLCFTLCESALKNRDDFMEIRDDIFGLIQKLKKRRDPDSNVLSNACMVDDPTVVKTKGASRQNRWAVKSRKCSHYTRCGHTIRRWPELYSRDILHTGHHQSSDELNDAKSYSEEETTHQSNDESNVQSVDHRCFSDNGTNKLATQKNKNGVKATEHTRVGDTSLRSKKYKRRCSNRHNVHKSEQPNNHDTGKTCQPNPIDLVKFQNQHLNGLPVYPTFPGFSVPPYHPYNGTPLYQSYSPYYYNVPNGNLFWNGEVHDVNENRKQ
ncbi:hypothetical protein Ahy_B05g075816 [Arachis hypogaea]|uniref:MULE transposase domain-containing protein n=1 Tax=Arachis hypogaea TaxID=3818 RepID=A0A444Z227_ARAHY|nr:hypothetical protein Ahy_B05g075816 [Arachis hypogaea]